MKDKFSNILLTIGLFLGSFVLFLYLSFPYGVLKETISGEISSATGMTVTMEDFQPLFPLGIRAKGLSITPQGETKALRIESFSLRVSVLSLLIARLGIDIALLSENKGELELGIGFGLFGLISGGSLAPSSINLYAKDFILDHLVEFGLRMAASGPNVNPLVGPVLRDIGFAGKLNGKGDISIDAKTPTQSSGDMNIGLANAVLKLSAPSLGLPDQNFSVAKLSLKLNNGVLAVDPSSKFVAEEFELGISGKVNLKSALEKSEADLATVIKIGGGMKEKFGFVIDAAAGGQKNGELTIEIRGPLDNPAITMP